jgi:predicted nucleic acid-binding protein
VRDLSIHLVPLFTVHWIGDALHGKALHRMVRADRRGLTLVDCTSFEVTDREGITDALALDADFAGAGYRVMPAGR